MTSLCDTCPVPGHCCRSILLNGGDFCRDIETPEGAQAEINRSNSDAMSVAVNGHIPFRPLFRAQGGVWVWWCPNLSPTTGRCLDYANRPKLCVSYQPGDDALCVLYEGSR